MPTVESGKYFQKFRANTQQLIYIQIYDIRMIFVTKWPILKDNVCISKLG